MGVLHVLDRTDPATLLEDLKRRRAALAERLARLHEARDRLHQAEGDESAALKAIGDLGGEEVAAMRAWAATGDGDPPLIDHARREVLTRELAVAGARADAARAAGVDVAGQIAEAGAEGAALAREIERAALSTIAAQFVAQRADLDVLAAEVRTRVAGAYGAITTILGRAEALRDAGDASEAAAVFRLVEAISTTPPDFKPSVGDVNAAEPLWAERLAELVR